MTTFNEYSPVWYAPDSGDVYAVGVGDTQIATSLTREHARRIVACVNACIGIPTAQLEARSFTARTVTPDPRDSRLKLARLANP